MSKPTKNEVTAYVTHQVSVFSGQPQTLFQQTDILASPPLSLNGTALNFLTLTLRGYILHHNGIHRIYAAEVRKTGLTVKDLIDLVYSKF